MQKVIDKERLISYGKQNFFISIKDKTKIIIISVFQDMKATDFHGLRLVRCRSRRKMDDKFIQIAKIS